MIVSNYTRLLNIELFHDFYGIAKDYLVHFKRNAITRIGIIKHSG
jgi:hypothetical protein